MTATLFQFKDGSKKTDISQDQERVMIEVDNEALMKKYDFIYDHAPKMWLAEDDHGYWPASVSNFFDNMYGVPHVENGSAQLMLTTRIPLTRALDTS